MFESSRETLHALRDALCTIGTTSQNALSNDCLVVCVGDAKLSLLQEVFKHY
jgi:hypothetical protein